MLQPSPFKGEGTKLDLRSGFMIKAGFISLGCVKNLVDTEVMLGLMSDNNIEIVDNAKEADYLIVNTCGFIETAKEESINANFRDGRT